LARKSKLGLRTCDGYAELLKYMRSDIQEIASRLQKGGLGYLDDNIDIEDQVSLTSYSISTLMFTQDCLIFYNLLSPNKIFIPVRIKH